MDVQGLIDLVCQCHGIEEMDMLSPKRNPKFVAARRDVARILWESSYTGAQIGAILGRKGYRSKDIYGNSRKGGARQVSK